MLTRASVSSFNQHQQQQQSTAVRYINYVFDKHPTLDYRKSSSGSSNVLTETPKLNFVLWEGCSSCGGKGETYGPIFDSFCVSKERGYIPIGWSQNQIFFENPKNDGWSNADESKDTKNNNKRKAVGKKYFNSQFKTLCKSCGSYVCYDCLKKPSCCQDCVDNEEWEQRVKEFENL